MPKIDQIKKKLLPVVKTTPKKTKTKKPKTNPVDYYNCLLTKAQTGWADPTGTKQKITQCCQDCKANAPTLNKQREQEISKLIIAYQQVGASLKKLLKPIK